MKNQKIIIAVIVSVMIFPSYLVIPLTPIVLTAYYIIYNSSLDIFKKKSTYFLFFVLVIAQPLLIGEKSSVFWILNYNKEILIKGLGMFNRAIVIINSIKILNCAAEETSIKKFWTQIGFGEFENVLSKTHEVLPAVKKALNESFIQIRKSGSIWKCFLNPSDTAARLIVSLLTASQITIKK